jgi:hypothetical protein
MASSLFRDETMASVAQNARECADGLRAHSVLRQANVTTSVALEELKMSDLDSTSRRNRERSLSQVIETYHFTRGYSV